MKNVRFFLLVAIVLLVSGCATFDGLVMDMQGISSGFSSVGGDQRSPAEACEPVFEQHGKDAYARCLEVKMMEAAPPGRIQFGKTFPECRKIYRSDTGQWDEYQSCQKNTYLKTVVLPEVCRKVQWRAALAERDLR